MFAQSYLGFAKSPVLVAHQAENGQQLRLVELGERYVKHRFVPLLYLTAEEAGLFSRAVRAAC